MAISTFQLAGSSDMNFRRILFGSVIERLARGSSHRKRRNHRTGFARSSLEVLEARRLLSADSVGVLRGNDQWYLDLNHDASHEIDVNLGLENATPIVGDFDGDGDDDLGYVRRNVWSFDTNGDGTIDSSRRYGSGKTTWTPVVGDWDGNGTDDIGLVEVQSDGLLHWYLDTDGDDFHNIEVVFGLPGDTPITGDWEDQGRDNVGVVRNDSNGNQPLLWLLDTNRDNSNPVQEIAFRYGLAGDTPVTGDWNDDGRDDAGVVRDDTQGREPLFWLLDTDRDAADEIRFRYGLAGDRPVVGAWELPEVAFQLAGGAEIYDGHAGVHTIDFGEVSEGESGRDIAFYVRNDGTGGTGDDDGVLVLSDLTVPEGFTIIDGFPGSRDGISKLGRESNTVIIRLEANGIGIKEGDVSFRTNDSNESVFKFRIRGQVNGAPDRTAPSASVNVEDIEQAGVRSHRFTVTYTDNVAVDVSDLDGLDILVSGQNQFREPARLVDRGSSQDGSAVTATYEITAPGGIWDAFNNATFDVVMVRDQVTDTSGNAVPSGSLGRFRVNIAPLPDVTPPTAQLISSDIDVGGGSTHSFDIVYRDNTAVDVSDFDDFDVTVTGPDGYRERARLVAGGGQSDGTPRTASYSVSAPGGVWDLTDAGVYTVSMESGQVGDTADNHVPAGILGTFAVGLSPVSLQRSADGRFVVMQMGEFMVQFDTLFGGSPLQWHAGDTPLISSFPGEGASINWEYGQDPTQASANGPTPHPIARLNDPDSVARFNYYARETQFDPEAGRYQVTGFAPAFWISHAALDDVIPPAPDRAGNGWATLYHNTVGIPAHVFSGPGTPVFFDATEHTSGILLMGNEIEHGRPARILEGRFAAKVNVSLAEASADGFAGIMFRREIADEASLDEAFGSAGYLLSVNKSGVVQIVRYDGHGGSQVVFNSEGHVVPEAATQVNTVDGVQVELRTHNFDPQIVEVYVAGRNIGTYRDTNPILGEVTGLFAQTGSGRIRFSDRQIFDVGMEFQATYTGRRDGQLEMDLFVQNAPGVEVTHNLYRTNMIGAFLHPSLRNETSVRRIFDRSGNELDLPANGIVPILTTPGSAYALYMGRDNGPGLFTIPERAEITVDGETRLANGAHAGVLAIPGDSAPIPAVLALNALPFSANFSPVEVDAVRLVSTWAPGQLDITPLYADVNNVRLDEGDTGTQDAVFTVTLAEPATQIVSIDYATVDGTARAGQDYRSQSGTLTFLPGETEKRIRIEVSGDVMDEADETFLLNLTRISNASLRDSQGQALIVDNDEGRVPSVSIDDGSVTEGAVANVTVRLSDPSDVPVQVKFKTASHTAQDGGDFPFQEGQITFAPGETTRTITLVTTDDATDEDDEFFFVRLSEPTGATLADAESTVTLRDDDAPPTISIGDVTVTEGETAEFTVRLSQASERPVSVRFVAAGGTASPGDDSDSDYFDEVSGRLNFEPGQTTATIQVETYDDSRVEDTETFVVVLSSPVNATVADGSGQAVIVDNDESQFDVAVQFLDEGLTVNQQAEVLAAAERWTSIITGDLPDALITFPDGQQVLIDDLGVLVQVASLDGNTLAQGGVVESTLRPDSRLPAIGAVVINADTLPILDATGQLGTVILHELGHALGYGTLWQELGLVIDTATNDPRFIGEAATREYNAIFGVSESSVPVENAGGPGSSGGHWRESVFQNELMSSGLNTGLPQPLSRVTAAAMQDLGYEVNLNAADEFQPIFTGNLVPGDLIAANFESLDFMFGVDPPEQSPAELVEGTLRIDGAEDDDVVRVMEAGDEVIVTVNGSAFSFTRSDVDQIQFSGNAGNDIFENQTDLPGILDGGAGNDSLQGGTAGDTLLGGSGDDLLIGNQGRDRIEGGEGDDKALGAAHDDTLIGGSGNDFLDGQGSSHDVLIVDASDAADDITIERSGRYTVIRETAASPFLAHFRRTEHVTLNTLGGDDSVTAMEIGDAGYFRLRTHLGDGNDLLDLSVSGNAQMIAIAIGGAGKDTLLGGPGRDRLNGGAGDGTLIGNDGDDTLVGGDGDDQLIGSDGKDRLRGFGGNDTLSGGGDKDWLYGGDGDDELDGGDGRDRLQGENGHDLLIGGSDRDTLLGGTGNDSLDGGQSHDALSGAEGHDLLIGSSGHDTLHGASGNDSLYGGTGDDILLAGDGNDAGSGQRGDDTVSAGPGIDAIAASAGEIDEAFQFDAWWLQVV